MFSAAEPLYGVGGTTACVAVGGPNLGSELGIMTFSLTHRGTMDPIASVDGGPVDYSVTTTYPNHPSGLSGSSVYPWPLDAHRSGQCDATLAHN